MNGGATKGMAPVEPHILILIISSSVSKISERKKVVNIHCEWVQCVKSEAIVSNYVCRIQKKGRHETTLPSISSVDRSIVI